MIDYIYIILCHCPSQNNGDRPYFLPRQTWSEAIDYKKILDFSGCCDQCVGDHELVKMNANTWHGFVHNSQNWTDTRIRRYCKFIAANNNLEKFQERYLNYQQELEDLEAALQYIQENVDFIEDDVDDYNK